MKLRHYQLAAKKAALSALKRDKSTLLVLPTGTGKTIVFATIAKEFKGRVLVVAHTQELLHQARHKFQMIGEPLPTLEQARNVGCRKATTVVASRQTLQGDRLSRWSRDHFDLIIIDEAHRAAAREYRNIRDHFNTAKVLGVTATPNRNDKQSIMRHFDNISFQYTLKEAIESDYLCPIRYTSIPVSPDMSRVRKTCGDITKAEAGHRLEPYLSDIADHLKEPLGSRKCIAFLPLKEVSKQFAAICNNAGISAVHVDDSTKDRAQINKDFKDGKFQILCNVMIYTEGFDEPSIEAVLPLRATFSPSLYTQMVGRGTRIHEGKKDLLIIEPRWKCADHDIYPAAHLIANDELEQLTRCESCQKDFRKRVITIGDKPYRNSNEEYHRELQRYIDDQAGGMKLHGHIPEDIMAIYIAGKRAELLEELCRRMPEEEAIKEVDKLLKTIQLPVKYHSCRLNADHPYKWGFKGEAVDPTERMIGKLKSEWERLSVSVSAEEEYYKPDSTWQDQDISMKQAKYLHDLGWKDLLPPRPQPKTKGLAHWYIDRLKTRELFRWASPKQMKLVSHLHGMTAIKGTMITSDEAMQLIRVNQTTNHQTNQIKPIIDTSGEAPSQMEMGYNIE